MNEITQKMRFAAREILEKKEVNYVIGWEKGSFAYQSPPVFIDKGEDVDRLIWDEFCISNLAVYLLDERCRETKVGLFVKGCDSRGVVRLIQDRQVPRDRVYIMGIPCPGVKDPVKSAKAGREQAPLADKCLYCTSKNPVLYDVILGDKVQEGSLTGENERFAEITDFEEKDLDKRYEFWSQQFDRCIRCFACRNICPACNCAVCCFEQPRVGWLSKYVGRSQNEFYILTRALHVAGRCIECGECERACPVNIPIMKLNRKIIKDINELFGQYEAGLDLEQTPPLGRYETDDPDEFAD